MSAHTTGDGRKVVDTGGGLERVVQPLSTKCLPVRPVSRNDDEIAPLMDAVLYTCRGCVSLPDAVSSYARVSPRPLSLISE
jgi:hypothetical protein